MSSGCGLPGAGAGVVGVVARSSTQLLGRRGVLGAAGGEGRGEEEEEEVETAAAAAAA
eukprot:COSAG02_NODE_43221_length_377_cov_0.550360_1_plen_57_part_10